ncbi:MAG TPA: 4Fe-4S dicluster domain-containing protein [Solirubrobacteraceae bacterium]|nr:4Fe-4S dicluster domain-containing protein [Solirubrobacteraceae bacterium]
MSTTLQLGATPLGPASYGDEAKPRMGFFTDTSICIGCKACEIACKEWNQVPQDELGFSGESFDNTGELSANSWRHVAFIEQPTGVGGVQAADSDFRWLMSSDVCKHCTHAACLDVCPTGAIFRTEFGTVVIQPDVCNGCGYCVPACPFGVIGRRERDQLPAADGEVTGLGTTHKCTLCYDRLKDGIEPACAKACPTDSIQFGQLDELRDRARGRVERLHEEGIAEARLYGEDPNDGVGGFGAFFLLLDDPEVYGLPPDPVVPTKRLPEIWGAAFLAGAALAAGVVAAVAGGRR